MQNPYTQPMYPCPYYVNRYDYRIPAPQQQVGEIMPVVKGEGYKDFFDLGDKAPDFTLDAVINGQPAKVSLSDYTGKWVVLFFYGSNFTFV